MVINPFVIGIDVRRMVFGLFWIHNMGQGPTMAPETAKQPSPTAPDTL